jgi:hypothetical protein
VITRVGTGKLDYRGLAVRTLGAAAVRTLGVSFHEVVKRGADASPLSLIAVGLAADPHQRHPAMSVRMGLHVAPPGAEP